MKFLKVFEKGVGKRIKEVFKMEKVQCIICEKEIDPEVAYVELYFCEGHPDNWGSEELHFCSPKCFKQFCKQEADK